MVGVSPKRTVRGVVVPSFFYGTAWKEERTEALTALALQAGFRAIDTANQRKHYFEAGVGAAVAAALQGGKLARADLFLQTKFTHLDGQDHRLPYQAGAAPGEQVAQSFASSLEHLQTGYIDSYVLHGPSARDHLTDEDWQIWRAMGELERAQKTRLIGVSNVSYAQVEALCRDASKPAFVQNRCYARSGWDRQVRELCRANDVVYQGFSLLTANKRELGGAAMARITKRTGRSVAQVVFRFALQVGMIPLTGTSDARHMGEDLQSFDFELSDAEMETIETLGER